MPALVLWIYHVRAVCLQFSYLSPRGHKRAAAAPFSISAFKEGRREKREGGWGMEERETERVDTNFSGNSNVFPVSSLISYRPEFSLLLTILGHTI